MRTPIDAMPHARHRPFGDVAVATQALFAEIASASGDDDLVAAMTTLNTHLAMIRPYEAAFINDRDEELAALSDSWARRDMTRLRALVLTYFQRRRDIVPQLVTVINNPN